MQGASALSLNRTGSNAALLGAALVDPSTLIKLMGHANLATTQRYFHPDQNRKRAAVESLSGENERTVNSQPNTQNLETVGNLGPFALRYLLRNRSWMRNHCRMKTRKPNGIRHRTNVHPGTLAYCVDEAASLIGVSRRTLYQLIAERRLNSIKLRGRRLITRSALEQLLAEAEAAAAAAERPSRNKLIR
jgi:excisionase family DNA binding protein